MFLDELSFDELTELENLLISKIKNIIGILRQRNQTPPGARCGDVRIKIKFKGWIIKAGFDLFTFRGKLPCNFYISQYREDYDLEIMGYSGKYYSHYMLLYIICTAYELNTRSDFDQLINKLNLTGVALV